MEIGVGCEVCYGLGEVYVFLVNVFVFGFVSLFLGMIENGFLLNFFKVLFEIEI